MNRVFSYSYGDESYGLVYQNDFGSYDVYEIPQFGDEEQFLKTFQSIDDAIEYAKSLT